MKPSCPIPAEMNIEGRDPARNIKDMDQYFTYILASRRNGTLYVGMAVDLISRVFAHRQNLTEGFTKRYGVHRLVWYEIHGSKEAALIREKRIKRWKRAWKIRLIEETNPSWSDLYDRLTT